MTTIAAGEAAIGGTNEDDIPRQRAAVLDGEELGYLFERTDDDDLDLANWWSAGKLDELRFSPVRLKDKYRGTHLSVI